MSRDVEHHLFQSPAALSGIGAASWGRSADLKAFHSGWLSPTVHICVFTLARRLLLHRRRIRSFVCAGGCGGVRHARADGQEECDEKIVAQHYPRSLPCIIDQALSGRVTHPTWPMGSA
eukprot:scaffold571_cov364-Prasinococcus_capsulatus_cf.AAC.3